jgi:hypothetical protein
MMLKCAVAGNMGSESRARADETRAASLSTVEKKAW